MFSQNAAGHIRKNPCDSLSSAKMPPSATPVSAITSVPHDLSFLDLSRKEPDRADIEVTTGRRKRHQSMRL